MGMFDHIYYEGLEYQTRNTPSQSLDNYKIEHDQCSGHLYLWHQEYDSEWVPTEDHFFGGYMRQFNERWVCCHEFDGNILFYRSDDNYETIVEYSALFMDGKLLRMKEIKK